ncbi:hypothetical protein D3C72_2159770 [compost metagenome]
MTAAMGKPRKEPVPMKISNGSVKVTMKPSVISWAIPRPATMSTSVATMGWMSSTATRKPFQRPQARPTASAAATATGAG